MQERTLRSDSQPRGWLQIGQAASLEQIAAVQRLFIEYAQFLDYSLCFQGFDEELAQLPGYYAPPPGRLLLAQVMDARKGAMPDQAVPTGVARAAGCVALRPLGVGLCEMKRLYVAPDCRGMGIGDRLAAEVVVAARTIGYTHMRLDTLESMHAAQALYRRMGFVPIAPYYDNPIPNTVYLELDLKVLQAADRAPWGRTSAGE